LTCGRWVPITSDGILASVSGSRILLWNLATQELEAVLEEHTDVIFSLGLSPDNQTLASGSLDKTVGLWNLKTKDLICTLVKRRDPIHSVAFSPNGELLASGGENKYKTDEGKKTTIYLWDVNNRELVHTFSGHDLRVNTLAFSADGKKLASGSNDNTVRLWDVNSGSQLHVLKGHSSNISTVAFTSDDNRLISSGGGGVKIWNVQTGELQKTFAEEYEYIKCCSVDPTGQVIAFGVDSGIQVWNLKSNTNLQYLEFKWPCSINFSPDGKFLASGDATAFAEEGGLVKVWRVPSLGLGVLDRSVPDIETKKKIELAAIDFTITYFKNRGFTVTDCQSENCGYDLLVDSHETTLKVEVKGTAAKEQRFFLSRNEKGCSVDPLWRLAIVSNVLKDPQFEIFDTEKMERKFDFEPLSWECKLKTN